MELTRRLLLVALLLSGGACLPGPEVLRERYNAELLLLGVEPGQPLEVRIDGRVLRPAAPRAAERVTVLLSLSEGAHEGVVQAGRGPDARRCAAFTLRIEAGDDRDSTSVDLRVATACTEEGGAPPPDGGPNENEPAPVFSAITERTTLPGGCTASSCDEILTVDAEGSVLFTQDDVDTAGEAPLEALEELALLVMSPDADVLFRDGCELATTAPEVMLVRERLVPRVPLPELVVDEVNVAGCDDPTVASIRASLASLRGAVFGE